MAESFLPYDDVSMFGMEDTAGGIFGFPSFEGYRTDQVLAKNKMELEQQVGRRPEQPLNIGFGAGGIDAAGPVRMDPFVVSTTPTTGMFDATFGSTVGTGIFGIPDATLGGGMVTNTGTVTTPPKGDDEIVTLPPVVVTGNKEAPSTTLNLLGYDPNAAFVGPVAGANTGGGNDGVVTLPPVVVTSTKAPSSNLNLLGYDPTAPFVGPVVSKLPTGDGGTVVLPPFKVNDKKDETTYDLTPKPDWFRENIQRMGAIAGGTLPPFKVNEQTDPTKKKDEDVYIPPPIKKPFVPPTGTINLNLSADPNAGKVFMGPVVGTTPTAGTTAGGGSTATTSTGTKAATERDFAKELGITLAALQKYQPELLGMYKDLYQSFMPQGLTAAETSGLAQMRLDEEKLNRLRQGLLSPEDIRTATQGAREAYGARGQVFAPGAIGAEILNREAIRQQREDQARAAYQQSMGNVLNVANLQTGNIFQPIGSLLSSTFNPLGAYPADVYGTNVNAALARDINQKNYEAAIESAKIAGAAGTSAAKTAAGGSVGAALLPSIIAALPGIFCWVAREVYGEHNPRWQMFRHWMLTRAPRWFFRLYLRHGEKFAKWLKRNPWLKPMIRRWMDSRIESMRPNHALKEAF